MLSECFGKGGKCLLVGFVCGGLGGRVTLYLWFSLGLKLGDRFVVLGSE